MEQVVLVDVAVFVALLPPWKQQLVHTLWGCGKIIRLPWH